MTKKKKESPRNLCPAPDCGMEVNKESIADSRERLWHRDCAFRTLAGHFRTPLDLEALDGEPVAFEVPGEFAELRRTGGKLTAVFRSPREFALRAIRFGDDDFGLYGGYIGAEGIFYCAPTSENAVFGDDFDERLLSIGDRVVHTGIDVTFCLVARGNNESTPRLTLVGELFDPKERRRKAAARRGEAGLVVAGLYSHEHVEPGATVKLTTSVYTPTHFERLTADAHADWSVERVSIGCFIGDWFGVLTELRSVDMEARSLCGRRTPLPTFVATPGESVTVHLRNNGAVARRFAGRLIGTGSIK